MIKAIIFDLDGTLLDTSHDICEVLNGCMKKYGLPEISYEDTLKFVGNGAKKLVERALGKQYYYLFDKVYPEYAKDFADCLNDKTFLYDGEERALLNFKNRGIKLALLSNKPHDATVNVYEKHLKKFEFAVVAGNTEKFPLKPDPTYALSIIERLGVLKEECIFVGDGETDVQTAQNAGIRCISCLWGFRSEKQLLAAGAKRLVKNFAELEQIVENKNY